MRLLSSLLLAIAAWAAPVCSPSGDGGATCSGHPCTVAVTCATATCTDADIVTAFTKVSANVGDIVTLQAGKTFTTNGNLLPVSGITVKTDASAGVMPVDGARITPSYKNVMPTILFNIGANHHMIDVGNVGASTQMANVTFDGIRFASCQGCDFPYYNLINMVWDEPMTQTGSLPIQGVSGTVPNLTFTMSNTSGLSVGNKVTVFGFTSPTYSTAANGWWDVSAVTPNVSISVNNPTGNSILPQAAAGAGTPKLFRVDRYNSAWFSSNTVIKHCLFEAAPLSSQGSAIRGDGSFTVRDSYIRDIKLSGVENKCIAAPQASGPVVITDVYCEGGSQGIFFGGAIPTIPGADGYGLHTDDITITHNAIYRPLYKWQTGWGDDVQYNVDGWRAGRFTVKGKIVYDSTTATKQMAMQTGVTGQVKPAFPATVCPTLLVDNGICMVQDGTTKWTRMPFSGGTQWLFKNNVELKAGTNVVIKWNGLEGSFPDSQSGPSFLLNGGAQNYIGVAQTYNLEVAYNTFKQVFGMASFNSGQDWGDGIMHDIDFHDNLHTNPLNWSSMTYAMLPIARFYSLPPYFSGLKFRHNTWHRGATHTRMWIFSNGYAGGNGNFDGPIFTDNLMEVSGMVAPAAPMLCSTCPVQTHPSNMFDGATINRTTATFAKNVISGENLANWPNPANNYNTAWSSIPFVKGDDTFNRWDLRYGALTNAGTDGKTPGADYSQLPMIQKVQIRASDKYAIFTWKVNEPWKNNPCSMEMTQTGDFYDLLPDLDASLSTRPDVDDRDVFVRSNYQRMWIAGLNTLLTPATTYKYRLHCGGAIEEGSFTTTASPGGTAFNLAANGISTGQASMYIRYGYSYSRASNAILAPLVTNPVACTKGQSCALSFTVAAGVPVYYQVMTDNGYIGPVQVGLL